MTRLIRNQRHLSQWVREQEGPLDIAVAFWGDGALKDLGLDRAIRRVRILLDLSTGATNPRVVRALLKTYPGSVRALARLHAKAYIAESEILLGSANASANGLGLEGREATQWYELGIMSRDLDAVQAAHAWFADLWSLASPIDVDGDAFEEADRLWRQRQKSRPLPATKTNSLISAAIENPHAFSNRGWYVVVDLVDMDDEGHAAILQRVEDTGHKAFAWQGWHDIPVQSYLLSFHKNDRGHFVFSKEKGAVEPVYFSGEHNDGLMQFVTPSYIPGFRQNLGDIREWRKLLTYTEKHSPSWLDDGGICIDLGELVANYSAST